jgi:outer membrane protein TolC
VCAAGAAPTAACQSEFPAPFAIPLVLDNWLFQATLTIPISDYFLRIDQNYTAATQSQEATKWDVAGARATALANGEVAYYTWLRARAAIVVQVQTLNDQKTHLRDSHNQFAVGNASKADVLRAETSVWSAELSLERAKNLADLTEKQLRVAMHAADAEVILPGEDLETPLQPAPVGVSQLIAEALGARAEIKSAEANAEASRKQAQSARAGRYPTLSAFGDAIEGNPNPRIFPPSNHWFPTWDLGAQVTWSPNDILTANGSMQDYESRVAATEANKNVVRDGIQVEVTQDLQAVEEADFALQSTARELASAQEAYRVATELFNNGRGTYTTVSDAETDLTRARLDILNAKTDARIARIHLDHALGRDLARANASATPQGTRGPQAGSAASVLRY